MDKQKQQRFEAAGWSVDTVDDFLGTIPLEIPFTTTDHGYSLYQFCKERKSLVGRFWADSVADAQRAVETMYGGADVIFESKYQAAFLEGICPADSDALEALYLLESNGKHVAFFCKGHWSHAQH